MTGDRAESSDPRQAERWPELPLAAWQDTYATLHMWTQIVGKLRMRCSAPVNHWWHVTFGLTSRGLTTGPMHCGTQVLQADFDFCSHEFVLSAEGGERRMLTWPASVGRIRGYRIYRDGVCITTDPMPATTYLDTRAGTDAEHSYSVSVVDRGGQEGPRSGLVTARALPGPTGPAYMAALTAGSSPIPALQAPAELTAEGLDTRRGGWATVPNQPEFRLEGEFAVSLRFRADSVQPIPVLASCGEFQKQGWFVQVLGGGLRFSLGGNNILDAGRIEPGRWYHLACTYGGARMRVYLNGREAGSREAPLVDSRPWTGTMFLSQYHFLQDVYQFRGLLRDLRVFAYAPSAEEVLRECEAGSSTR